MKLSPNVYIAAADIVLSKESKSLLQFTCFAVLKAAGERGHEHRDAWIAANEHRPAWWNEPASPVNQRARAAALREFARGIDTRSAETLAARSRRDESPAR